MTTTWLRNARLPDGRTVDVSVVDGTIDAVADPGTGTDGHDLGGWLLLPAMAEPHAHLDKALTAEEVPNPKGDLMGAIDAWIAASASERRERGAGSRPRCVNDTHAAQNAVPKTKVHSANATVEPSASPSLPTVAALPAQAAQPSASA